jgi:cell division control protein 6
LLDPSTRSTLQRNIVHLDEYSPLQLHDILSDRVNLAFRSGAISDENINFVVESTSSERGDARCAIELLWRSGKYADTSDSTEILPEHVRKAAVSIYPSVRKDIIDSLSFHEKMFLLSIARSFKRTAKAYLSMGEAEESYTIVCEEWGEKARGHTQIWKYLKELYALGVINTEISGAGIRGKTTLISLPKIPASDLERVLTENLRHKRR